MESRETLRHIGLNEKESSVYLALLEIGEASVLKIAKKAVIKRPTAYLILHSLESKGLVSRVEKKRQTLYAPQHPRKILAEAEIRLKEIQNMIPQFEAMMLNKDSRPRVVVFEGKEALDRAYDDSFVVKGEILYMSNMDLVQEVFARTLQKFEYVSLSPAFRTREIADDSEVSRAYARRASGPYRQVRLMPKEFSPFATDIGIFGNTTLITSAKKEYFTVKIESEDIANAFRAMFEAMWQISKPAIETTTS
ncbi:MAG: transcriptional regulator TrmB [Parcubacteria group bacterium Gr01-1014_8]|nr:MAG: transcriptional regulator TrmB [Parcubacteria group bacterium Gr01-1014_8]